MKRLPILSIVLVLAAIACGLPAPTQQPAGTPVPGNTAAPATQQPPAPTNTQGPPPANATCGPLSLYFDPALATSYSCETVPEAADTSLPPMGVNPQYSKLTLVGYPLTGRLMVPHIDVFPVQRYRELMPDLVNPRVEKLQNLIGGAAPGSDTLPLLPIFNAAQMFYAQYAVVHFQNGNGIRYVTMYAQAYYPVNNHDMFFSFQGMTADGKYWISLIVPISHPSLPENGDNPPGGYDAFVKNFDSYIAQTTQELNGKPPESFVPSILALDALVQSMVVQP
jgi:hypothetical protein